MDNKHTRGWRLPFIAQADHAGGDLLAFDGSGAPFAGVNSYTVQAGEEGVADLYGVFELPKTTASTAITQGAALYASGVSGRITVDASGDIYIGRAYGPSNAGATHVLVNLNFGSAPAA